MEYNIIASNCVGARYYELNKLEFPNPFMWGAIKLDDFIRLITEWDVMNFKNIRAFFTSNEVDKMPKCSTIEVDNKIRLYFIHHNYVASHKSVKVPRSYNSRLYDVEGNDILEYLSEKWEIRAQRMGSTKPIFVYVDDSRCTNISIKHLLELKTDYLIILFSKDDYSSYENPLFHYIKTRSDDTRVLAEDVDNYLKNREK